MHNKNASTARGGNAPLNFILSFAFVSLLLMGAKLVAQDIGEDLADGANTAVTVKHVKRPLSVHYDDNAIVWNYVKAKINNADSTVISKDTVPLAVVETIADFKLRDVTISGKNLTGAEWLAFGAKFGKQKAEAP